jgi:hypothetical protein
MVTPTPKCENEPRHRVTYVAFKRHSDIFFCEDCEEYIEVFIDRMTEQNTISEFLTKQYPGKIGDDF